jgi:hypothetical protein
MKPLPAKRNPFPPSRTLSGSTGSYPELLNNVEQSFNPEGFRQYGRCAG